MKPATHNMPALLTYEDYCQIPSDGNRYEVIDGMLYMSPSPSLRHQRILNNLAFHFTAWERQERKGKIWIAPVDVLLSNSNVVQPDLVYISNERLAITKENYIEGAPDLVVEVLSPSNRRHDVDVKRTLYEKYGVREYWIVDPVGESIQLFRREASIFEEKSILVAKEGSRVTSPLLPKFERALIEVFEE